MSQAPSQTPWPLALAAHTHHAIETALNHDPAGPPSTLTTTLRQELFPSGMPSDFLPLLDRAHQWAIAGDRPDTAPPWYQVNYRQHPALHHPLSGEVYRPEGLAGISAATLNTHSAEHFKALIHREGNEIHPCRTALAFWRFGAMLRDPALDDLWPLLPADPRVPDHTLWTHLDLMSAFAGAMADGQSPALLLMSFGPVQDFIAQSRSTSDLWAGSHLLSRLAWEGLKVICERQGPAALIFPQLRGVPLVDLWLRDDMHLDSKLFRQEEWTRGSTDANPLFAAALPNRFVAIVPQNQVKELANQVTEKVRDWVQKTGMDSLALLLDAAGENSKSDSGLPCWEQLQKQLAGFPEVHWSSVPWSLVGEQGGKLQTDALTRVMTPFYPSASALGFLGSDTGKLLMQQHGDVPQPNPGTLYPAIYELTDRLNAAAKSIRAFEPLDQMGNRCSLSGESEWLTTDRKQLDWTSGQRNQRDENNRGKTLWTRAADKYPSWVRPGEHLGALATLKRLWPTLFLETVRQATHEDIQVNRYVVSTHTMALATSLDQWLSEDPQNTHIPIGLISQLSEHLPRTEGSGKREDKIGYAALPRKLARRLRELDQAGHDPGGSKALIARRLPAYLDRCKDLAGHNDPKIATQGAQMLEAIEANTRQLFGKKPETYYALIMLDGDRMGAWLSGEARFSLPYGDTWHRDLTPPLRAELTGYRNAHRAPSAARHMAISAALNAYALDLSRYVVEDLGKGKLFYAGGDDVMAMVSVDDLLAVLLWLRVAYGGGLPNHDATTCQAKLTALTSIKAPELSLHGGFVQLRQGKHRGLLRLMGSLATASAGAVVAHHTAPLAMVLRELRAAEKTAKEAGGRDAFSISLLKRAGGKSSLTLPWWRNSKHPEALEQSPMGVLLRLRRILASPGLSRRVSYLAGEWLASLPDSRLIPDTGHYRHLLHSTLGYQFRRQITDQQAGESVLDVVKDLVNLAVDQAEGSDQDTGRGATTLIRDYLNTAEFLAREGRTGSRLEESV